MRRLTVIIAALALVAACADDPAPEVDADLPEDDPTQVEDDEEPEPDDAEDGDADDGPDDGSATDDTEDTDTDDPDTADEQADAADAATPDPDALEDPCGDFDEGVDELLSLVAPVDDQHAEGELDLVGCAQVPEGTVQYRLLDGDGVTLDEGFTTAECGGPCVGAFRETVSLTPADGEPVVYVQVFWEDLADGEDRDLIERIVVLE